MNPNRHTAELHQMQRSIADLLLYQDVLNDEIGTSLISLLQAIASSDRSQGNALICLAAYGRFFNALAAENKSWEEYLIDRLLLANNPFTIWAQKSNLADLSPALVAAARQDLQGLHILYTHGNYIPLWVQQVSNPSGRSIVWNQTNRHSAGNLEIVNLLCTINWGQLVPNIVAHYQQNGVGIFAKYRAFRWQKQLIGIADPDRTNIDDLVGYEYQKATLMKNTESLLSGNPALNILLYGGKGTGKSSLVKGLLNYYSNSQLRLIEVSKSNLIDLSLILEQLVDLPQKFIIFVDDLSFEADDEAFKALKVVLEGSITAKPTNVVVYATSNRRHLVREYFTDRPRPQDADDIHMWDTTQEKLSFSDRFGITLTFEPAEQSKYLTIIHHLAKSAGLSIDSEDLEARALQWATRHNGRSGRTAKQFIDYLLG